VQVPFTQVWLLHGALATHAPELLHVSGAFIAVQPVDPAAQTPVQTPLTHVVPLHAAPLFCQVPLALQLWGCWPLHCV
jgi:hypothetical protein